MDKVQLMEERAKQFPQGDFNDAMNSIGELLEFLLPEQLGVGISRSAHSVFNRNSVVKCAIQYEGAIVEGLRSNITEFDVWCYVMDKPELSQYFAEVKLLSKCGKFLEMEKCTKLDADEIPDYVPAFLCDTHTGNFGRTQDGRVVCIDYGQIDWVELVRVSDGGKLKLKPKRHK